MTTCTFIFKISDPILKVLGPGHGTVLLIYCKQQCLFFLSMVQCILQYSSDNLPLPDPYNLQSTCKNSNPKYRSMKALSACILVRSAANRMEDRYIIGNSF